jgi:hypothetical protein
MSTKAIVIGAGLVVVLAVIWIVRPQRGSEAPVVTEMVGQESRFERQERPPAGPGEGRGGWSATTGEPGDRGVTARSSLPGERGKLVRPRPQRPLVAEGEGDDDIGMGEMPALPETEEEEESFEFWQQRALAAADPEERMEAIESLDRFEPEQMMAVLTQALADPEPEVRLTALQEIWLASDEPPLDILAPVLQDPDPEVRLEALRIVGESEDRRALGLIESMRSDPDNEVSSEAHDLAEAWDDEDSGNS